MKSVEKQYINGLGEKMKTCTNCSSSQLNTYMHKVSKIKGEMMVVFWVNCLACKSQVDKRIEFMPITVGK